ncbi:MAG: PSD1 and planctomycete cytochrome C domain-containing protein [Gemmataceae bacterium]|nr:PSD1 and planctomycete cytochrome C domain-containing protein [Gemmataceae bacterium]
MKRFLVLSLPALLAGLALAQSPPQPAAKNPPGKVQFARDIQPILAANCLLCHGPDEKERKGGLRLDLRQAAIKELRSGARAIVPGNSKDSELIARINSTGSDRMPPAKGHAALKAHQKELLRRWIDEGAEYQKHWAFVAPQHPEVPAPRNAGWARNPIDRFVLARLEREGLKPAPEADRYALARRVAIDLTGLPPTLAAVDRFVNDPRPDAYERYVDELLRSTAYGERWAHVWLDQARYADSNGYADDGPRAIWKYRDWVIDAINRNLPFDQFTIEQIAGDLLPGPTTDQLIATAFHRNTLTNTEGGTDDEEFRSVAVVDRVNTTMQVWMGVTMACAQCHDHKYDPLSQEEYFKVYALLNQTEDSDKPDNRPVLPTPTPEQTAEKSRLEAENAALEKRWARPEFKAAFERWEERQVREKKDPEDKSAKKDKLPANVQKALAVEPAKRNAKQKAELVTYFRSTAPKFKDAHNRQAGVQKQLAQIKIITTPVMRELPEKQRRTTHIHIRGNFLDKGKQVSPGVPSLFPPLRTAKPQAANRLDLARWLVAPDNPLTARVTVNRYWEQIFGVGLVETPDDYGTRGKLPTHPELLDWLAVEFMRDWDVKRLLRLMVTSATYRQSSRVTPDLVERDPDNRLFARGPRYRASAEAIRDQALVAGGLLSTKMHGPPVRPERPKLRLNAAFGGATDWDTSPGEDKHRRAMYTFWRRTTPYPSMVAFDAPNRNVCTVNRPRTNTPLQALVTLNDPCFVEAAQALARRVVREGGETVEARASHAFRLCLSRPPRDVELRRLVELYNQARSKYVADQKAAVEMATQPLGPVPPGLDAADLAAWTIVGNVLLNLDEMFARR